MRGSAGKHGGINLKAYDNAREDDPTVVEILVAEYFADANWYDEGIWRCGDRTGVAGKGKGSFQIEPNGRCTDFDYDLTEPEAHPTLLDCICSEDRDCEEHHESVFAYLCRQGDDYNFFMPVEKPEVLLPKKGQSLKGTFAAEVGKALKDEEFWFTSASKAVTRIDKSIETWVNDEGVEVEARERLADGDGHPQ